VALNVGGRVALLSHFEGLFDLWIQQYDEAIDKQSDRGGKT